MSKIKAVIGGNAKGLADQVWIDPALGCKYLCVGCYAKKSCQRGKHYDNIVRKELDKMAKSGSRLAGAVAETSAEARTLGKLSSNISDSFTKMGAGINRLEPAKTQPRTWAQFQKELTKSNKQISLF